MKSSTSAAAEKLLVRQQVKAARQKVQAIKQVLQATRELLKAAKKDLKEVRKAAKSLKNKPVRKAPKLEKLVKPGKKTAARKRAAGASQAD